VSSLPRIAVTLGDPAGIGPEVIVKGQAAARAFAGLVVVGDAACLRAAAERWAPGLHLQPVSRLDHVRWDDASLPVLDLANVPAGLVPGRPSPESGRAAVEAIRAAVDLALRQEVDAITTAPISKEAIHLAGFPYPGHTEMLADLTHTKQVALMLAGGSLRVVLATTHVPLAEVHALITPDRVLNTLRLTHRWLTQFGIARPRLAVTGLNPHCGDGGIFGEEEIRAVLPAVEAARREGMDVSGPHSADALFGRLHILKPDAVVTMYHDQGMIPIKMASMGHAVNITLGLPIIRTSVDHGTAYDIAGQGLAEAGSFIEAVRVAAGLARGAVAPQ